LKNDAWIGERLSLDKTFFFTLENISQFVELWGTLGHVHLEDKLRMTLLGVLEAKCKWIILGKVFLWGINFWVHILQHEQDYIEGLGSPKSEVLCGACNTQKNWTTNHLEKR
jgi:hypothetical protein